MKLKGGDEKGSILAEASKRMALPSLDSKSNAKMLSHYQLNDNRIKHNNSSKSDLESQQSNGNALAKQLGLPSAVKSIKSKSAPRNKDTIYIQPKTKSKSFFNDEIDENESSNTSEEDESVSHPILKDPTIDQSSDETLIAAIREKRINEMKRQIEKKNAFLQMGHGEYNTLREDEFLPCVTRSKYVVCHFYHCDFERCKIIDRHFEILSHQSNYLPTRFVRLDVEKSPFFVDKLNLRILPTIICFKDGIAIDRIIGFEELGENDNFSTKLLEKRLAKSGVILIKENEEQKSQNLTEKQNALKPIRQTRIMQMMDDDSDDQSDADLK